MRFVDSHLHIGKKEADSLLALADATDTLLVTCGVDRLTSQVGVELASLNPGSVIAFVGLHPSEVLKSSGLAWVRRWLDQAAGLGEVGLDPTYSSAGRRGAQMKAFLDQLEMARRLGKPVQVHSRGAERAALDALDGFRPRGVLMHWFEGEGLLSEVLVRGYFVSYGPALLYSKKLQRMAARSPPDQVLTETDSPVAYGPLRGARGPTLVPSVVFKLAQLWGTRFEEARASVVEGASRFLGISGKG